MWCDCSTLVHASTPQGFFEYFVNNRICFSESAHLSLGWSTYKVHPFDSSLDSSTLFLSSPVRNHVVFCFPNSRGCSTRLGCSFTFHIVYIFLSVASALIVNPLKHVLFNIQLG